MNKPSGTDRTAAPAVIDKRNKHNALRRYRPASDPAVQVANRDLTAARAEAYIRELVDTAPALTPEQRDRLALLLRPNGEAGA